LNPLSRIVVCSLVPLLTACHTPARVVTGAEVLPPAGFIEMCERAKGMRALSAKSVEAANAQAPECGR
jgi:predicted transglutaminase-like cysteine proteinase